MRHVFLVACGVILSVGPSLAQDSKEYTGEWLVENKSANIKIDNCGGSLWGVVSWEIKPGTDSENPDPALRGRPTLGIPILIDLKPAKGEPRWEGQVYNASNGKMYSANIRLLNPNTLKIEGCLFTNFLCGGQEWTRVVSATPAPTPAPQPKAAPKGSPKGGATAATSDVCSRVSSLAGRPH
jgi:uncharacterized protein (DUF2147 family)